MQRLFSQNVSEATNWQHLHENPTMHSCKGYSGNIQGTFREHSGNIQGTLSEPEAHAPGLRLPHAHIRAVVPADHLNHANRSLNHANCSLNHANCSLNQANCSLNHANCSLNHTNCSLNDANRSLNHANCSLNDANCSLNHANCPLNHANCPLNQANRSLNHAPGVVSADHLVEVGIVQRGLEGVRKGSGGGLFFYIFLKRRLTLHPITIADLPPWRGSGEGPERVWRGSRGGLEGVWRGSRGGLETHLVEVGIVQRTRDGIPVTQSAARHVPVLQRPRLQKAGGGEQLAPISVNDWHDSVNNWPESVNNCRNETRS
jgi:hypothetical protein